ncbi:MAG TPA: hypothetical protein GXX34_09415 [Clostridia bacterium]|nr:hypothetical protein [Clostridia bacterium]
MAGTVCPLCNGLIEVSRRCPRCGSPLEDQGQAEVFYDPYSPYEDDALVPTLSSAAPPEKWCWHVVACPACLAQDVVPIAQWRNPQPSR